MVDTHFTDPVTNQWFTLLAMYAESPYMGEYPSAAPYMYGSIRTLT